MRIETIETTGGRVLCTVYEPIESCNRHVAIVYLHGGGLLYGERDDLPKIYLELITKAGYTLFCLDYPLAPEAPLPLIRDSLMDSLHWIVQKDMERLRLFSYVLFGRSAGAYLSLLLAKCTRTDPSMPQPAALVDFYGYHDLTSEFFSQPSASYLTLPGVSRSCVKRLDGRRPVTSGPKALRFSLYVYARQTGTWRELLGAASDEVALSCSLSNEDLAALPPLFIAASTSDDDVPFSCSKSVARKAPHARMKTVYYLEHDFDRDTTNPIGRETYEEFLAWLNEIVS